MASYTFYGTEGSDQSGWSVSSAGDVDGDGKDDLIIGAIGADGGGSASGEAYLVMSSDLAAADAADGNEDGKIDLDNINDQPGSYQFIGTQSGDNAGFSVASAGDVDGDGKADLIIGANLADGGGSNSGEAYLLMSSALAAADAFDVSVDGVIDLDSVNNQVGSYQFFGTEIGDYAGVSVASAGDVDGDGKDDLIIGAQLADGGGSNSGEVYLVMSSDLAAADAADGGAGGQIDLDNVNEQPGSYQFIGTQAGDRAGYSVASAGDVDGDGKADLIIGAYLADGGGSSSGEAYLIMSSDLAAADAYDGSVDGVIDLDSVNNQAISYQIIGAEADDFAGISAASAGDVDGDGKDDLIIGAYGADGGGSNSGEVYLIMSSDLAAADAADGSAGGQIDLGNISGQPGSYQFIGTETGDGAGYSVASAGDVDGDGKADLIIGAYAAEGGGSDSGESYLILSSDLAAADALDGSVDGVIDLDNINEQSGSYQFIGAEPGDIAGISVSSAGDVDGDGKDDLIIGAYLADGGGSNSGESYLVTAADLEGLDKADGNDDNVIDLENVMVKAIMPTANDDTLEGTFIGDYVDALAGDDDVEGLGGEDTLIGGEGQDTLDGGEGDDGVFGGTGDDNLSGGEGDDEMAGADGNDFLNGDGGNDNMGGGLGNDTMNGDAGNDTMGAGQGNDEVDGGSGDDGVFGGAGNDTVNGGDGNDNMAGSYGTDLIIGGSGDDDIGGGTGKDTINAGDGNDTVGGGEGDDVIDGGAGNDFLAGGGRDDSINGNSGNDSINAGVGDDTVTGGSGNDVFIFTELTSGERDVITDWTDGEDVFRFTASEINNAPGTGLQGKFDALNATQVGGNVELSHGGHTIVLQGASVSDLSFDDFIFV